MKLAILHYLPLEYYPPVCNLIDYIANERSEDFKAVKVYSCHNVKGRKEYQGAWSKEQGAGGKEQGAGGKEQDKGRESKGKPDNIPNIHPSSFLIKRSPFPKENDKGLVRLLKYLHYNLLTLMGLITYRPNVLLYYESYSVWPTYVYARYFNRKCRIHIHNHEYAPKEWYAGTMKQVRYFHRLEKKWLYPRAQWISQTNADRLQFFHQDHPALKPEQLKIMPNYPPNKWKVDNLKFQVDWGTNQSITPNKSEPVTQNSKTITRKAQNLTAIKLVYVGSLSFQSTYLKEVCEWVLSQNGKIQFDVYAYNLYSDIKTYLKALNSPNINYYEQGIEYNDQPNILMKYDVGLILYKAHNQNYTYNAPNKLFEYLACDLDVWYPDVLQGPQPYNSINTYPKVIPVDFEHLDSFKWQQAMDKTDCTYQPSRYFCEEVYKELVDEMLGGA